MSERPGAAGRWLLGGGAALGLAVGAVLVSVSLARNEVLSLPLDDAWIHLTYARNLAEHGTYSYSHGTPATQGSTSPLFTLALALLFFVSRDHEKVLGIGLSLVAQAGFLAALAWWARARLRSLAWAAAVVAWVATDANTAILSVSGMETSLFLLLVALAFAARASGRGRLEGTAAGLAVWARPEGLVLGAVLALDRLLDREKPDRITLLSWAGPVGAWAIFNLAIGGSLLPNSFAAKTAFYAAASRAEFVQHDLRATFWGGGWLLATLLALAAAAVEAVRIGRGRASVVRAEVGWAAALPLAYLVLLPFGHRFERYLVPALPAIAVAACATAQSALATVSTRAKVVRAIAIVAALVATGFHLAAAAKAPEVYARFCRYHLERHERTGRWLAEHTPESAVVATHDIGAIGFYSKRRIVDTVGLVLPEAAAHLDDPGYLSYLADLFRREGVTHVAALRNWLRVANVEPLFLASREPEILEVYPWIEGRTHLVPRPAARLEDRAVTRLKEGKAAEALSAVDEALAIDPSFAPAWVLAGQIHEMERRFAEAEAAYRRALALAPDDSETYFRLAVVLAASGRRAEAAAVGREVLRLAPGHRDAEALMRALDPAP